MIDVGIKPNLVGTQVYYKKWWMIKPRKGYVEKQWMLPYINERKRRCEALTYVKLSNGIILDSNSFFCSIEELKLRSTTVFMATGKEMLTEFFNIESFKVGRISTWRYMGPMVEMGCSYLLTATYSVSDYGRYEPDYVGDSPLYAIHNMACYEDINKAKLSINKHHQHIEKANIRDGTRGIRDAGNRLGELIEEEKSLKDMIGKSNG